MLYGYRKNEDVTMDTVQGIRKRVAGAESWTLRELRAVLAGTSGWDAFSTKEGIVVMPIHAQYRNSVTILRHGLLDPVVPPRHTIPPATAPDFLTAAKGHMEDRAATYDAAAGERSMAKTVAAFNALNGTEMTEVQGWQFMAILKLARSTQGAFRSDSFEDGCAYVALAGEAAAKGDRND